MNCLSPLMRSIFPQRLGDCTFLSEVPVLCKFIVTFPTRLLSFASKRLRGDGQQPRQAVRGARHPNSRAPGLSGERHGNASVGGICLPIQHQT